ncbi:MAG TPA: M55 family metallopeptidase [Limnochordales bacterium]
MRIYISVDMEGVAGTFSWRQDQGEWRPQVRRLMTLEVNAAVEGALEAGATRIVVNDAHDEMANLDPELLHPAADLVQGTPKPLSMVEGVEEGFDAAFFVGYHAAAGTAPAVLDHTYSGSSAWEVRINGRPVGEAAINAAICGHFGVPVVLVSGDETACRQAQEWLPWARTVAVKKPLGRYAARAMHPDRARRAIREAARAVVSELAAGRRFETFAFQTPVVVELTTSHTGQAEMAALMPGVERVGPRTVRYQDPDVLRAFRAMRAMLVLAGSSR